MNKKKAVLKYYLMSNKTLIERGRFIVSKMTGNVNFPTPTPTLAVFIASLDAYDAANEAALNRDIELKAILRASRADFVANVKLLRDYVNLIADGDEVKILSSGFFVNRDSAPVGELGQVQGLEQVVKEVAQTIRLRWNRLDGAKSYNVEMVAYTPGLPYPEPTDYRSVGNTTATRFTIKGQRPGATFLVRVAGLGASGLGTWSDPLTCIVV